jgi:hypothetical protein
LPTGSAPETLAGDAVAEHHHRRAAPMSRAAGSGRVEAQPAHLEEGSVTPATSTCRRFAVR